MLNFLVLSLRYFGHDGPALRYLELLALFSFRSSMDLLCAYI